MNNWSYHTSKINVYSLVIEVKEIEKMRLVTSKGCFTVYGKLSEQKKIEFIATLMMEDFSSACLMHFFGGETDDYRVDQGYDYVELCVAYDSNECTVKTIKESYICAKKTPTNKP